MVPSFETAHITWFLVVDAGEGVRENISPFERTGQIFGHRKLVVYYKRKIYFVWNVELWSLFFD
jgi:hypothetical protein